MSSVLRRRGKLPPLVPFRELQDDHELDSEDPFEVLYISPCQIAVSNDPFEDEIVVIDEPNPCNITMYDCSVTGGQAGINAVDKTALSKLVVVFDYELHYTIGANFTSTLEGLEASILEHLASGTGLVNCPITAPVASTQRKKPGDRHRLLQTLPDLFVAVGSDPIDKKDQDYAECGVPVETSISQSSICQPMTGRLTTYLETDITPTSNAAASIRSGVQRFIRAGMNSDVYVTGNVRKVSFIGTRAGDEGAMVTSTTADGEPEKKDKGLDGVGIAMVSLVSILAVLFVVLGLLVRRRRARNAERDLILDDAAVSAAPEPESEYHSRRPSDVVKGVEGADVPGSLATTDSLALRQKEQGEDEPKTDSDSDKSENGGPASPATAKTALLGSKKTNTDKSPKKKKKRRRKKKDESPPLERAVTLESIPEEEGSYHSSMVSSIHDVKEVADLAADTIVLGDFGIDEDALEDDISDDELNGIV